MRRARLAGSSTSVASVLLSTTMPALRACVRMIWEGKWAAACRGPRRGTGPDHFVWYAFRGSCICTPVARPDTTPTDRVRVGVAVSQKAWEDQRGASIRKGPMRVRWCYWRRPISSPSPPSSHFLSLEPALGRVSCAGVWSGGSERAVLPAKATSLLLSSLLVGWCCLRVSYVPPLLSSLPVACPARLSNERFRSPWMGWDGSRGGHDGVPTQPNRRKYK